MEPWPLVMPSDEELLSLKPQTIAGPSTAINLDPSTRAKICFAAKPVAKNSTSTTSKAGSQTTTDSDPAQAPRQNPLKCSKPPTLKPTGPPTAPRVMVKAELAEKKKASAAEAARKKAEKALWIPKPSADRRTRSKPYERCPERESRVRKRVRDRDRARERQRERDCLDRDVKRRRLSPAPSHGAKSSSNDGIFAHRLPTPSPSADGHPDVSASEGTGPSPLVEGRIETQWNKLSGFKPISSPTRSFPTPPATPLAPATSFSLQEETCMCITTSGVECSFCRVLSLTKRLADGITLQCEQWNVSLPARMAVPTQG